MLRALLGLPLRPGAIRGGASFVWLASCPRDSLGSPRLEAELPPLRLGFSFGNPWLGMALSVRGLFPTSVALHAWCIGPLGYTDYGCAGRYPGCCFGPLVWHRLWAPWAALGCARIVVHRAVPKVFCCRGQDACSLDWLRALLRPFRGLCATLWRGVQVTLGPVTMGHCLCRKPPQFGLCELPIPGQTSLP
ncbi:hypothetical protein V6N11_064797 [Hibiscus sabdariffa]|uniref:Secreted protein n=1 Tax=Hibiscus sabdariffa TaxID=183260 RepID=A0ABR2SIS4_9ROSI